MAERLDKLDEEFARRFRTKELPIPIGLIPSDSDTETPEGVKNLGDIYSVTRKHPQRQDKPWERWIIFLRDEQADCMWAHYGENIRHTRTKYPEQIRDIEELGYCLKYFTDPPGSMVLISTKEKK